MKCKEGYKIKDGKCVKDKKKSPFQYKFTKNLFGASVAGLASVFGWLIVQGLLSIFPRFSGTVSIIVGLIGLATLGYLGYQKLI